MTRPFTIRWRLALLLVVVALELAQFSGLRPATPAYAQDLSADPKTISPGVSDLRSGFQIVPDKTRDEEPLPGIRVYELDFTRDQTPKNFADGPIEIKSLVAKTASAQQAAEQFTSSRQALTTASPPWVESKVAKLGDEATGLTMEGQAADGAPAVAHLFLFRRGAMVVGITVAGWTKPTRMAEAEAIAAVVLGKLDPSARSQAGPRTARQLNTQRPPATNTSGASSSGSGSTASAPAASGSTQRVRVANTGGTSVRLRVEPSLKAQIAARLAEGTVLEVVGEDRTADGYTWKNVRAPGDGRGWVAANYVVAVSGGSGTTTTAQASPAASSTPAAATTSNTTSAPNTSTSASTQPASSPPSSSATTAGDLKVDVNVKKAKIKPGDEQSVEVVVTRNGQPVSGAQVTVKTSPTNDNPAAPATDGGGKSTVTWKPTGTPPGAGTDLFVGVGVSAATADGSSAGVGGASFAIANN